MKRVTVRRYVFEGVAYHKQQLERRRPVRHVQCVEHWCSIRVRVSIRQSVGSVGVGGRCYCAR